MGKTDNVWWPDTNAMLLKCSNSLYFLSCSARPTSARAASYGFCGLVISPSRQSVTNVVHGGRMRGLYTCERVCWVFLSSECFAEILKDLARRSLPGGSARRADGPTLPQKVPSPATREAHLGAGHCGNRARQRCRSGGELRAVTEAEFVERSETTTPPTPATRLPAGAPQQGFHLPATRGGAAPPGRGGEGGPRAGEGPRGGRWPSAGRGFSRSLSWGGGGEE